MICFADIVLSTEASVAIGALLSALAGAIGIIYRQLIKSYESKLANVVSARESFKEMVQKQQAEL